MILIVNDDGINSSGIWAAYEAVKGIDDVTIVAPAVQQSGVGRSISLFSPVIASKTKLGDATAYSVKGTPVDAVILGFHGILKAKPDLVISGINLGENMSSEATTSGTVGAALEAASQGAPAIAVSQHTSEAIKYESVSAEVDFSLAKEILRGLTENVLERGLPTGVDILNVNVPEKSESKEIRITRLARRMYTTRVQERYDPRGRAYFWIDGDAIYDTEEGTDVHAVRREKRISITPLKLDFTSHESLDKLKALEGILEK
ncbi:MAG: 5'/3'-nucleotidase SurE [Candidatus Hydrothermarchaeales archaeon]